MADGDYERREARAAELKRYARLLAQRRASAGTVPDKTQPKVISPTANRKD